MSLKVFADITKVDEDQRMVYGYASTTSLDSQGDIITKDALSKALPDYMKYANIREMHQNSAVGVAESAEVNSKGVYLAAKVIDEKAWQKVKTGVYKGFSIGGRSLLKTDNVINELSITEISLVDRPANPECVFEMYKAEGMEKVDARNDVNPKEGESKYGDVNFADESNKKYPIDTAEHIRAAWNYINQDKNASQYSSSDVGSIKAKIVAAWKSKLDPKGPPSAESASKSESSDMQKVIAGKLQDAYKILDEILKMSAETVEAKEVKEEVVEEIKAEEVVAPEAVEEVKADAVTEEAKSATIEDIKKSDEQAEEKPAEEVPVEGKAPEVIEKAGARNSKSDGQKIQGMHDAAVTLGASCGDMEKAANPIGMQPSELIEKSDTLQKVEALEKQLTESKGKIAGLEKALAEIALLPTEKRASVMNVISKSQDSNRLGDELDDELAKSTDPKDLIKMAHRKPVPLSQFLSK